MDTHTLWTVGRNLIGHVFSADNPSRLPIALWCEIRILIILVVTQNEVDLNTQIALHMSALRATQKRLFKTKLLNLI